MFMPRLFEETGEHHFPKLIAKPLRLLGDSLFCPIQPEKKR
jgi:hypothetical protein